MTQARAEMAGRNHKEPSEMPDDETPPETGTPAGNGTTVLPDEHPLVKAHKDIKAQLADAKARLKEADDANKSELQKALDAVAEKDRQLADLPKTVRAQAIKFASTATQMGFLDPEDALVFIDADLADDAAVKAALEDLAQRKPHLVRQDTPKPKTPARPKPKQGAEGDGSEGDDALTGKERAAAALRAFRSQ